MKVLLLCASCAYLLQHITSQLIMISSSLAKAQVHNTESMDALFSIIVQPFFTGILYYIFYILFAKRINKWTDNKQSGQRLINLSVVVIITVVLLSSIRDYFASESLALALISRTFSVICCFLLLYLRVYIVDASDKENEKLLMERLYYEQQKQYQINKETIDLINEKCHDMRHTIAVTGSSLQKDELKELISIYDETIRTGNSTLDTIFAEKSIMCQKYGIRLSPIIDGASLEFMEIGDICSLFGNILENAIEAVSKLDKEDDRIISIKVQERAKMIIITCDNYYSTPINYANGSIETTKDNNGYHGFGLKSIKRTAQKYGGTLTINTDEMFHLIVVIPVQNN